MTKQELVHVKIENINMPFFAMVGLMFKFWFATMLVGTVVAFLYFLSIGTFIQMIVSGVK